MSNTCIECEFHEESKDKSRHTFDCSFHNEAYLWITPCSKFKLRKEKLVSKEKDCTDCKYYSEELDEKLFGYTGKSVMVCQHYDQNFDHIELCGEDFVQKENIVKREEPMNKEYNLKEALKMMLDGKKIVTKQEDVDYVYFDGTFFLTSNQDDFDVNSEMVDGFYTEYFPPKKKVTMYRPDVYRNRTGAILRNGNNIFKESKTLEGCGLEGCVILRWDEIII